MITAFNAIALQKKTYDTPEENLASVRKMLDSYKGPKPDLMMLPEIFTCPYDNKCFPQFAERDFCRNWLAKGRCMWSEDRSPNWMTAGSTIHHTFLTVTAS